MIKTIQDVLHYADDYVHGLLSEVDAESLERLCERNAVCRAALEEAHRRHDALGSLPPTEADEKLVGRTMEHIITTTHTKSKTIWSFHINSPLRSSYIITISIYINP